MNDDERPCSICQAILIAYPHAVVEGNQGQLFQCPVCGALWSLAEHSDYDPKMNDLPEPEIEPAHAGR